MKKHGCLFRMARAAIVLFILFALFFYFYAVLPMWGIPFNGQRHTHVPITPPWALECWLWEDDVNTGEFVMEMLDGCVKYDIPVRTILIDSPWSTRYNDFIVDEARYPKPAEFFKTLQDRGYRVVLWMTCMANSKSDDTAIRDSEDWFDDAAKNGYLVGGDYQMKWWKGRGGFIDYTNPEAAKWWQGMQQQVLDWGIDGWKLDGCATFFSSKSSGNVPLCYYQRTHAGWMTTRGYMDHYYRDEYQHGLTQNPEFITLARAIDKWYQHPEGFAPLDAAPVCWVGDRRHAWKNGEESGPNVTKETDMMTKDIPLGIESAINDILLSAKRGYCVVGDDVGGYHGSAIIPPRLYIRWAEFAAFTGLFLNGGHSERRLWKRSPEELEIIRKFSWLHTELVPYMYSYVVRCHEGGPTLQRPVKGDYHYLFGDDFLVAPIYRDSLTNTVTLPKGKWRYLFDDREVIEGPKTFKRDFPLDEFSVYIRDGAIVPLNVSRAYTGVGDTTSQGYVTWNIYPNGTNEFTLHNTDNSGTTTVKVNQQEDIAITFSGVQKPHVLRILSPKKPAEVTLDGKTLVESTDWRYEAEKQRLWITTQSYSDGRYRIAFAK